MRFGGWTHNPDACYRIRLRSCHREKGLSCPRGTQRSSCHDSEACEGYIVRTMSLALVLPDVNLLLAFGWRSHPHHRRCRSWIAGLSGLSTCAITELGFLRVSMSPAYRASYQDASNVLQTLTSLETATFLACDLSTSQIAPVASYKDTTDCYLVELARKHSLKLATLDQRLLASPWSGTTAFNPFRD